MLKRFKCDKNKNLWYQYELNGRPFRWVEVKFVPQEQISRNYDALQNPDETGVSPMNRLMKQWARVKHPRLPKEALNQLYETGEKPDGYSIYHILHRSLGGQADDLDNIVLMKTGLQRKLHSYFGEAKLQSWLEDFYFDPGNADRKVFISVPILPPVVTAKNIPYAFDEKVDLKLKKKRDYRMLSYLKHDRFHYAASIEALETTKYLNRGICQRWKEQKALEAKYISGHPDLQEKTKLCRWNQKHAYLYQRQNEGR